MFVREKLGNDSNYFKDGSSFKGHAKNVILPNDETELREGIRYSSKGNTKVTISGNRTGKSGGAVPNGGDVIYMGGLNGIIGVGSDDKGVYVKAYAGTCINTLLTLISGNGDRPEEFDEGSYDRIQKEGLRFPVDANPISSVGGCISANRCGIRDYVRKIKIVFSDSTFTDVTRGEYFANGRRMMFPAGRNFFSFEVPRYDSDGTFGPKVSENMDLIDLFIGSEGIFGVITEAEIYLSKEAHDFETRESGKVDNHLILDEFGKDAVEDLKRIKGILDQNYILNIGNMF